MKTTDLLLLDQHIAQDEFPTMEKLADALGQAPTHIWAGFRELKEQGFEVVLDRDRGGYRYRSIAEAPLHVGLEAGGRFHNLIWIWDVMIRRQVLVVSLHFSHTILEIVPLSLDSLTGRQLLHGMLVHNGRRVTVPVDRLTILQSRPQTPSCPVLMCSQMPPFAEDDDMAA